MTKIIVDAFAWIEYFNGSDKGLNVKKLLETDHNEIITCSTTVAEVISKVLRKNLDSQIALNHINNLSKVIDITQEISILAGEIHFIEKKKNVDFGMLDSFVAATAKKLNAKILTGDNDFKNFKETIFI